MQLGAEGVEDAHIPLTGIPTGATITASIDRTTWVAVTATLDANGNGEGLVLLAGPNATGIPTGTPVVPVQGAELIVRISNGPETIERSAGKVTLL